MKKILSSIIVGVMLITLAGCGTSNSTESKENTDSSKEVKEEIVKFGDSVDCGSWNIKINKVEEAKEIKGLNDSDIEKANGKFVTILIDLKNTTSEAISYSFNDYKLKDTTNNKTYTTQSNVVSASQNLIAEEKYRKKNPQYVTINDKVNPDDTKTAPIAFDVDENLDINNLILVYDEHVTNTGKPGQAELALR